MERSSGAAPPRQPSGGADGQPLSVAIEPAGNGVSIVSLAGELDLSTIPQIESRLLEELGAQARVVVDLTRLTFIDSSGIGLLIKAHRATKNGHAMHAVVSESSQVERVFAVVGIEKALPVFLDRDDAIAAL